MVRVDLSEDIRLMRELAEGAHCDDCMSLERSYRRHSSKAVPLGIPPHVWWDAVDEVNRDCLEV